MALSWKLIFCAALLIVSATAETGDYVVGSGDEGLGAEPPTSGSEGYGDAVDYVNMDEYASENANTGESYLDYISPPMDYADAPESGPRPPAFGPAGSKKPVKPTARAPRPAIRPKPAVVPAPAPSPPRAVGPVVMPVLSDFLPRSAASVCASSAALGAAIAAAVFVLG